MKSARRPAWVWVSAALLAVFPLVASASAAGTRLASPGEPQPASAGPSEPKASASPEWSDDVEEAEPMSWCGPWIGEPCGTSGRCWRSCRTCHNPTNGNDWRECSQCANSTGHGPC